MLVGLTAVITLMGCRVWVEVPEMLAQGTHLHGH